MHDNYNGSNARPENFHLRCTVSERGRMWSAIALARKLRAVKNPEVDLLACEAFHRVIIPTFEKVIRGFLFGSAAERSLAAVYLEEFIRRDDYLSVRRSFNPLQTEFDFDAKKKDSAK